MIVLGALVTAVVAGLAEGQAASAKAVVASWDSNNIRYGTITFQEIPGSGMVRVTGVLRGLTPGPHGFHIHALGDLEGGCPGATGHFNPSAANHGAPTDTVRHAGDLGNIQADASGRAVVDVTDRGFSLFGPNSVLGRAVMVHAGRDDLGRGGDAASLKTGNAGGRVGCGVIAVASSDFVQAAGFTGVLANQGGLAPPLGGCADLETRVGRDPSSGVTEAFCANWQRKGWCTHPTFGPNIHCGWTDGGAVCSDADGRTVSVSGSAVAESLCALRAGRGLCTDPAYADAMRAVCAKTCHFCV